MPLIRRRTKLIQYLLSWTLIVSMVTGPSVQAWAQTNAAAMSVRTRLEGTTPEGPESPQPGAPAAVPGSSPVIPGESSAGKIDLRYLAPKSAVVAVVRPSQILASPFAQVFPVEVASAAAMKYLGFDAAEMEEVVGFADASNPVAPGYGVAFKFKNPIRATSIPVERRAHAQLADLGGKKYLRSASPMMYSLYGPNNRTLVAAPDAALHQLVESMSQPKSGPLLDRVHEVSAGNDLYLAVDVAALRPFIQMGLAQSPANIPPAAKANLEMLNEISAVELTLNVSAPGPTSFVLHCNDDEAAQKVETAIQEALQKMRSTPATEQPMDDNFMAQAMERYWERMRQPITPQRNGTSITCVHIDGQNPAQQQLVAATIIGIAASALAPAIKAAQNAAMKNQATLSGPGGPGGPEGPMGAPGSPEGGTP